MTPKQLGRDLSKHVSQRIIQATRDAMALCSSEEERDLVGQAIALTIISQAFGMWCACNKAHPTREAVPGFMEFAELAAVAGSSPSAAEINAARDAGVRERG